MNNVLYIMLYQLYSLDVLLSIPLILIETAGLFIYFFMIFDLLYNGILKKIDNSYDDVDLSIYIDLIIFLLSCIFPIIIPVGIILFLIHIYKYKNIKHYILYDKPLYGDAIFSKGMLLIHIIKTMEDIEKEGLLTRDVLKAYCNKYHIFEDRYKTKTEKYLYLVLGRDYDYIKTIDSIKILEVVDKYTDIKDKILKNEDCSMYSNMMVIDYITEYLLKDSSIDNNILKEYVLNHYAIPYYMKIFNRELNKISDTNN